MTRASAKQITALYERRLRGDEPTPDDWRTTRLRALAALDGQHGINVTESLCEKAGWDRWAVAIKTPYHARAPSAERRCLELSRQQTDGVEQGGR